MKFQFQSAEPVEINEWQTRKPYEIEEYQISCVLFVHEVWYELVVKQRIRHAGLTWKKSMLFRWKGLSLYEEQHECDAGKSGAEVKKAQSSIVCAVQI